MIDKITLDSFTDGTIAVSVDGYDVVHIAHVAGRTVLVRVHDFDADGDMDVVYSRKITIKEDQ